MLEDDPMYTQKWYVSPPLPFRDAARVWAAAAGIAGAFWPRYFGAIAGQWRRDSYEDSPAPDDMLRLMAATDAAVIAEFDGAGPAPKKPVYYPGASTLCWESSVMTWLYPSIGGRWIVSIDGIPDLRRDAALAALR